MAPSAALLISLAVVAGVADVTPTLDTTVNVDPVSAAGLPFLDYEDPPQLLDPPEDKHELEPKIAVEEEPEADEVEEAVEEEVGEESAADELTGKEAEVEEQGRSLQNNDLPEERLEEDAGAVVAVDAAPQVVERAEAIDLQDAEHEVSWNHSGDHEDDPDDHEDPHDMDFDHLDVTTQQLPAEHLQSLRSSQLTADSPGDHNRGPENHNRGSEDHNRGPEDLSRDPEDHNTEPAAGGTADDTSLGALVSSPVSFSVKEGGNLVIPCGQSLEPAGDLSVVSWLHSGRVLVAGGRPVSSDGRHQLLGDGSLRLTSALAQDDGMFICRVAGADGTFTETTHHVHVKEGDVGVGGRKATEGPALQVITEPAGGVSVVRRGQPATLACWVPGEPTATVTWTKEDGGTLPYGESVLRGPRLEIGLVDRTHRGTYTCTVTTADSRTAVRSLQLQVNSAPEVRALESVVHTGEDHQAVIRCQVFSHPPAQVHWSRPSGQPLRPDHHLTTQEGDMFSLTLLVETADLDIYICSASNVFGSDEAAVVLTGRPCQPVVTSPARGPEPWSYTLSWQTPSVPPLIAYKLLYRQHMSASGRPSGAWREAIIPLDDATATDDGDDDHRHQYVIGDLEPDSEYEAHVMAENRHGWSEPSVGFRFRTAQVSEKESALFGKNSPSRADTAGGNSASSVRAGAASLLLGAAINLMIRL